MTTRETATAAALMTNAFEALARKDLDALEAMWHDDVIEDFVAIALVDGKAAARAFFSDLVTAIPDLVFRATRVMGVDESTAVGEWHLEGTFDGGPFLGVQPTGGHIMLRGIDVMEFDDGRLRHNTVYYDGLTFTRQMGLLPTAGSMADRALRSGFNALVKTRKVIRHQVRQIAERRHRRSTEAEPESSATS
jgi:steroid delta-isomerase-like uncharacterized protein